MERRHVTRLAAPVAFLAAITTAALLIRAGLEQGSTQHKTAPPAKTTVATTAVTTTTQGGHVRTYTVQSGDTFESIARKTGTTVRRLEQLNPKVDPTALQVGQVIRVK